MILLVHILKEHEIFSRICYIVATEKNFFYHFLEFSDLYLNIVSPDLRQLQTLNPLSFSLLGELNIFHFPQIFDLSYEYIRYKLVPNGLVMS
jgi:hypothetical protein